jgi:hypothetical protein
MTSLAFRETVADFRWALMVCLALYAALAALYVTAPAPSVPSPAFTAPVYFCPAGQHLVSPNLPTCKPSPEPLPAASLGETGGGQ